MHDLWHLSPSTHPPRRGAVPSGDAPSDKAAICCGPPTLGALAHTGNRREIHCEITARSPRDHHSIAAAAMRAAFAVHAAPSPTIRSWGGFLEVSCPGARSCLNAAWPLFTGARGEGEDAKQHEERPAQLRGDGMRFAIRRGTRRV